jgi:hypothetical protein
VRLFNRRSLQPRNFPVVSGVAGMTFVQETDMEQKPHKTDKPQTKEEQLEEGLEDTFPASDPPSTTREPQPKPKRDD